MNLLLIDMSYFIFYRYYAICAWWRNAKPEISLDLPEENREFILSDITGGLYPVVYGSADNPATVYEVNGKLFLVGQPDTVYGGDVFDGTGEIVLDSDGNLIGFTLDWSNGYGDAGVSVFTLN